jgi:glycosyltransferase involved in cell wall biosynthesis
MITTLLGIGTFGLLGLSVLCPLLAITIYYFRSQNSRKTPSPAESIPSSSSSVEIIIPAHNEARLISATLESIQRSVQYLQAGQGYRPLPKVRVHVGADGCTDQTSQIARQFAQVRVTEFYEKQSKWVTIKALLADSTADWVILVDVGAIWPKNFLYTFVQRINGEPSAIAIAPSYRPMKVGWLPHIIWQMETSLKRFEAFCGGPVSLHGATVGYKTDLLKQVLAYLGDTLWLNDDVVIPLILRSLNPNGVILYPVGEVLDAGILQDKMDLGRRKRLVLGNLQWVRRLLPDCFRLNPVAGVVAGRRLFRVLWAYWLAFIILGLVSAFHFVVLPGIAALGVLMVSSGSFRQLSGAALISLLTPFLIMRSNKPMQETWL